MREQDIDNALAALAVKYPASQEAVRLAYDKLSPGPGRLRLTEDVLRVAMRTGAAIITVVDAFEKIRRHLKRERFLELHRRFSQAEEAGVSVKHLAALERVEECPGLGVSELAAALYGNQKSGIVKTSELVERLVGWGFLERSRVEGDRRRVALGLTDEGGRFLQSFR